MEKLTGNGYPSSYLVGEVGQWYEDLDTGDIYECRVANKHSTIAGFPDGGYVWERRMRGEDVREFFGESGVSSWNDLTDKPFDEEIVKIEDVISQQEISVDNNSVTIPPRFQAFQGPPLGDYIVTFDGEIYSASTSGADSLPYVILGNPYLCVDIMNTSFPTYIFDSTDNGLPFAIFFSKPSRVTKLLTSDNTVAHTIEAYRVENQVVCIDEKFIPDTIVRTSDISSETWTFTLEDDSTVTKKVVVMSE